MDHSILKISSLTNEGHCTHPIDKICLNWNRNPISCSSPCKYNRIHGCSLVRNKSVIVDSLEIKHALFDCTHSSSICVRFNEKEGCKQRKCKLKHCCLRCFNLGVKFYITHSQTNMSRCANYPKDTIRSSSSSSSSPFVSFTITSSAPHLVPHASSSTSTSAGTPHSSASRSSSLVSSYSASSSSSTYSSSLSDEKHVVRKSRYSEDRREPRDLSPRQRRSRCPEPVIEAERERDHKYIVDLDLERELERERQYVKHVQNDHERQVECIREHERQIEWERELERSRIYLLEQESERERQKYERECLEYDRERYEAERYKAERELEDKYYRNFHM